MVRKVILDVDTGSDDAVAIMLAALNPNIELVAVSTVKGNLPLETTTENTKRVLDLCKSDVPLYVGCKKSLVKDYCPWQVKYEDRTTIADEDGNKRKIHEEFSMLPPSNRKEENVHASVFIADYFKKHNDTTLVCTGPLTNLATALSINPDLVLNVEELVIMGGGDDESNATSSAEFNFFLDAEAAQRVFQAGFKKITLCPLDVTHKAIVTKDDCGRFEKINTPASLFAKEMIETRIKVFSQNQPLSLPDSCAMHDPLCLAYLIDESVLTDVRFLHLDVSLAGLTYGAMIVDRRYYQDNRNVYIAYDGDRKKFVDIMCDTFKNSN